MDKVGYGEINRAYVVAEGGVTVPRVACHYDETMMDRAPEADRVIGLKDSYRELNQV